jgi:hypothetical protein
MGLLPKQLFRSQSKRPLQTRTEVKGNKSIGVLKGNVLNPYQTQMTYFSFQPTNSDQLPLAGSIPTSTTTTTFSQPPEFVFYNEYTLHRVIFCLTFI